MAVFRRVTKEELADHFTHYGWMFGIWPVYVGDPHGECRISTRNWLPEWPLDLLEMIHGMAAQTRMMVDPYFEPSFAIKLTGPINHDA